LNKESDDKFVFAFVFALVLSWLFAGLMKSSGFDQTDNIAWYLVSGIRWLLTFAVIILAGIMFIPKWLEGNQSKVQRKQEAYENAINAEVQRRLRAIRDEEWREKDRLRKIEEAKQEEERKRKQLEAQWRKEYVEKLEEEFKATRTATDATQNAFNDFV
jgi:hypothetical protein